MFATGGNARLQLRKRSAEHRAAKQRIGAAAAASIRPGETILLDSGTTTMEIARRLPENADITVVTCALDIALEAGAKPGVTVIVCGGRLNPRTLSTADSETGKQLSQIFADRLFLGTYGIHVEKGLAERSSRRRPGQAGADRRGARGDAGLRFQQVRRRRAGHRGADHGRQPDHHRRRPRAEPSLLAGRIGRWVAPGVASSGLYQSQSERYAFTGWRSRSPGTFQAPHQGKTLEEADHSDIDRLRSIVVQSPLLAPVLDNWQNLALPDCWLAAGADCPDSLEPHPRSIPDIRDFRHRPRLFRPERSFGKRRGGEGGSGAKRSFRPARMDRRQERSQGASLV